MFNLIKMDFYRLRHSVSSLILFLLLIGYSILGVLVFHAERISFLQPTLSGDSIALFSLEISLASVYLTGSGSFPASTAVFACWLINSFPLLTTVIIFTALFVQGEQKNGFFRTIAGRYPARGVLVRARFVTLALCDFLILATLTAVSLICAWFAFRDAIVFSAPAELLKILGLLYLPYLALTAFVALICILFQNATMGIGAGLMFCAGLDINLYHFLGSLLHLNLERYAVSWIFRTLNPDSIQNVQIVANCIAGSLFILAVCFLLSLLIVKKRDIS